MRNTKPKKHPLFDKILNGYGKSLKWCLKFKVVPLMLAVILLGISVYAVINMGIVYLPEIATNELELSIRTTLPIQSTGNSTLLFPLISTRTK